MKTLMMVIFVIGYILSVLRSLTDKPTAGAAALGLVCMLVNFAGIMTIIYLG